MRLPLKRLLSQLLVAALMSVGFSCAVVSGAEAVMKPVSERFVKEAAEERPSFQRHVLPLMGRLGCNGRSCHGSFQGQGGFRLSLFGYDFESDHKALLDGKEPRVNVEKPLESLILTKPVDENLHEGGQRFALGGWEYRLLRTWIEQGAKNDGSAAGELVRLEVQPSEIIFKKAGETVSLRAIAHWNDGTREDVTPISRFQTNDDAVAAVDSAGVVTSKGSGDTHVVVFYDNGIMPVPTMLAVSAATAKNYPKVPTPTKVDQLVVAKLQKLGIVPSELASDTEFLRRVSLDMTGTLPSAQEVEAFLADKSPNKRAEKIDELLERPAYGAWWATKFGDWTGNNSQAISNAAYRNLESQQWHDWIAVRLQRNEPYDKIVEGIVLATSRKEGQSFEDYCQEMATYYRKDSPVSFAEHHSMPHYWSRRTTRLPEEKALSFAYAFMGVQIQCAQCHKHPFDQWTQKDFEQFTAFFTGLRYGPRREDRDAIEKIRVQLNLGDKDRREYQERLPELIAAGKVVPFDELYFAEVRPVRKNNKNAKVNNRKQPAGRVVTPKLLGAEEVALEEHPDPREALMDWLRAQDNPYFARGFVNRVWANYFNVGIINPPDDQNLANPPSNEPLLDWLTQEFIARDFDIKWLHRTITNSRTYQLSWRTNETNELDLRNFSHAVPRRLQAEVAFDALRMAVTNDEDRKQLQNNVLDRAIGPNSGLTNGGNKGYALVAFGKPLRVETCDCERSIEPSLLQTLYLRNDSEVLGLMERRGSWLEQVARSNKLTFAASTSPMTENDRLALSIDRQIRKLERDIKQLSKQEGQQEKVARLREQRTKLEKKLGTLRTSEDEVASEKSDVAPSKIDPKLIKELGPVLVRDAYLRTLSRPPTDDELQRSLVHIGQSDSFMAGLRDLLWVLVNTKEFIVNH